MTRTRKSKGGRLIGRGAYGWVFSPPLKCIGEDKMPDNKIFVSKIFLSEKSALEEYRKGMLIKELDSEGRMFITPESICEYEEIQDNANYAIFNGKKTKGRAFQIIYKNGGLPIENILVRNPPYPGRSINFAKAPNFELLDATKLGLYIKCLKSLVPILDKLHERFIHADLHVGNILYNDDGVRIIDFGEAIAVDGLKPAQANKMKKEEFGGLLMIGFLCLGSKWVSLNFPNLFDRWLKSVIDCIGGKRTIEDYKATILSIPDL